MKKLVLLILLLTFNSITYAQKPWRTLTPTTLHGFSFTGDYVTTTSLGLDYEINPKYSIDAWVGTNYNYTYNGGWSSASIFIGTPIFKNKWRISIGLMYGAGNLGSPLANKYENKDMVYSFRFSRRFHLNK
jgi:hypothetical protein